MNLLTEIGHDISVLIGREIISRAIPDFPGDPERNILHSPQLQQPQTSVNDHYTNKPHRYTE